MKALIAIDGSAGSFEAIRQVCELLSAERDQVLLYYSPPAVGATELDFKTIEQGQSALAESIFTEAINQFPELWRPGVQQIVGSDDPRTDIVNCAHKCEANLIAVGARGLGLVARVLLGSVSRSVVHTATMPVLVAHERPTSPDTTGLRVLLACESLETGRKMAVLLGQFAWPKGSTCAALTVVPSVLGGSIPNWLAAPKRSAEVEQLIRGWVEEEKTQLADARQEMEAVCKTLPAGLHESSALVAQGHAAWAIIDAAQKQSTDLIVVGAKGSTPLGRFFVGSTCETVLNRAPCSVLVIHHT
jgi:nucleotide-binding universal stress UspA family protein